NRPKFVGVGWIGCECSAPMKVVRVVGLEPTLLAEPDFESGASTNSTTPATEPPSEVGALRRLSYGRRTGSSRNFHRTADLATRDLRYQMDFAAGGDRLHQRVLTDHPVYGDRHALLDLLAEAGKAAVEFANQPAHGIGRHLHLHRAAGELARDRS